MIVVNRKGYRAGALARALKKKQAVENGSKGYCRDDIETLICEGLTAAQINDRLGCGLFSIGVVMGQMKKLGFEIEGD